MSENLRKYKRKKEPEQLMREGFGFFTVEKTVVGSTTSRLTCTGTGESPSQSFVFENVGDPIQITSLNGERYSLEDLLAGMNIALQTPREHEEDVQTRIYVLPE